MSETSDVSIKGTLWKCLAVLIVIGCATATMIGISFFAPVGWPLKVTFILIVAAFNAALVASYLMHFLTEKKMVFIVFSFTVFFFAGLLGLTLWAMQNFPVGTSH